MVKNLCEFIETKLGMAIHVSAPDDNILGNLCITVRASGTRVIITGRSQKWSRNRDQMTHLENVAEEIVVCKTTETGNAS